MFNRRKKKAQEKSGQTPQPASKLKNSLLSLEQRLMFDAAAAATASEVASEQVAQEQAEAAVSSDGTGSGQTTDQRESQELLQAIASYTPGESTTEIAFVDPTVPDYQQMIAGLGPNVEVVVLDGTRDGMEQIAESLSGRSGVDAIHLISHGNAGELQLGTGTLTAESMSSEYADEFATIRGTLSDQADILVYGCNFGEGVEGGDAVNLLAELTGADVAASSDQTGHIDLGGDWEFEVQVGSIETDLALTDSAQMNWARILGTETVQDTFSSTSYSNNDGTQSWSSSWSETDAGGSGASGGDVRVNSSQLRIDTDTVGNAISRGVDLSSATSATLTFNYTNSLTGSDRIELRVSTDGGANYQTVSSGVFSNSANTGSGNASVDLSRYMSANTRIQFIVTGTGGGDRLYVDNVQVSYQTNNAPAITSNGGGATASISVAENTTTVTTVAATDADTSQTLTYSISGGADATKFSIDSSTGALSFASAPNYESPTDSGGNNVYDVTVQVSDGQGGVDSQAMSVTVTDLANEAPTNLSSGIELNADGGNDAYLISDTGLSQSLTATTVEIRFAANDTPYEPVLLSFNNPTGDELSIQIDEPANDLEIDFGAGNVALASAIDYRAALVDGAVHTLSVTWDNSAGDWSVYIDGVLIESGTGLSVGTPLDTTNGRFVFGQEQDAQNGGYDSSQYFSGTFYDVRIWNDARTAGEIAQYHQQQLDLTPAEAAAVGLVANWQMDGFDSSNQVVDIVSGNNLSIAHASGTGFSTGAVTSQLSLDENSANGSHVGFVTAEDTDGSEIFSYSLTDSAAGRFAVNSSTGEITVANGALLDYDTATNHSITVRVTDSGGLTYDETFTINLTNVNETPTDLSLSANTVAENAANGTVVGTLSGTDPDSGDTKTYSLTDTAGGRFAINSSTGVITVSDGSLLNYESAASHSVTVRVTDASGLTYDESFTINLTNANETPAFSGLNGTPVYMEDGTAVVLDANVTISDPELSAADNFNGATLTLSRDGGASSQDGFSGSGTLSLSGGNVVVGGTTIGTYTNSSGTLAMTFNSNATNTLVNSAMQQIAYSNSSDAPPSSVQVNWTFSDGNSGSQGSGGALTAAGSVTVGITAVNDAPTDLSLSANPVEENAANGTVVGTVSGTDPDSGDTKTYSFTDSAGGRFAINSSTGVIIVADGSLLDYESATSHAVTVRVTDSGGLTYDETFTINLTNVNEAPTGADATVRLTEDTAQALTPANFGFSDVDVGDSLSAVRMDTLPGAGTLTLSGMAVTAGQVVSVADITGGNLVFTPAANATGTGYASLTFSVRDSNNAYDTAQNTLTVNVTAVNDAPVLTPVGLVFNTSEGAASVAAHVSDLLLTNLTDVDSGAVEGIAIFGISGSGATIEYSLDGTTWVSLGSVSATNALLLRATDQIRIIPDADNGGTLSVDYRGWDQTAGTAGTKVDASVTSGTTAFSSASDQAVAHIASVNDAPTDLALSANTVAENAANGTVVGTVSGTDPDSGDTKSYSLTDTAGGRFAIDSATGALTVADSSLLNYESATSHSVTVWVTDSGGLTYDETFTINLTNVNETPTDLSLSANTIAENAANGTVVGIVSGTDPDSSDTKTYSLTDTAGGRFAIDSSTGQVTVADGSLLDYESAASHSVTVRVTDSGGLTYDETFTINLTNVNEAPTGVDATVTINEDTPHTLTAANFGFSDVDAGDSLSAVRIDSVPTADTLTLSGISVTDGQVIAVGDIAAGNLLFTPAPNAIGMSYANLTFSVRDSSNAFDTAPNTLTIDVTAVNDAPILSTNEGATVDEGASIILSAKNLDVVDVDNGASQVLYTITSLPINGTILLKGTPLSVKDTFTQDDIDSGIVEYQHDGSETDSDSFAFVVDDGAGGSLEESTFKIAVTPVNDTPTDLSLSSNTVAENAANGTMVGTVSGTDPDTSDTKTYTLTDTAGGRFAIDSTTGQITVADGSLLDYEAATSHSVTVRVTDSGGLTYDETFTINLTNVNETPTGADATVTINEDFAHALTTANFGFSDVDAGDSLSAVRIDTLPGAGTLTLSGVAVTAGQVVSVADLTAGNLVFTPVANATGMSYANITFSVRDSNNAYDTNPNTLTIDVTAQNDASVNTVPGAQSVAEDTPLALSGISVNDVDGNLSTVQLGVLNGTVSVTLQGGASISAGNNGTNTLTLNGSQVDINATLATLVYQGSLNYNGADTLTVTSTDMNSGTDVDTVALTVTAVNDATVVTGGTSGSGTEDTTITGTLTATDAEGLSDGTVFSVSTAATQGTASIDPATGLWSYQSTVDWNGSDSFTVTITDDVGNTTTQVISVTVTAVADSTTDSLTTNEDTAISANVLTGTNGATVDSFEGTPVLTSVTQGVNGTVTFLANGTVTYTPNANFNGTDSFTYTITSGGVTETATVTVTVNAVNDATVVTGGTSGSGNEDTTVTGTLTATDADGLSDGTVFNVSTAATNGMASIDPATGLWSYTPTADWNGSDSFTVTITDDVGNTTTQVISVTVTAVNDAPTLIANTGSTVAEGGTDTIAASELVVTDVDTNDAQLTYTIGTGLAHGQLELISAPGVSATTFTQADIAANRLVYIHDGSESTSDSFSFIVSDGASGSLGATTVTLMITPVNDAPTITSNGGGSAAAINVAENVSAVTIVTGADPDLPSQVLTYSLNGGADQALFTIDASTGALSFSAPPDFEVATDANGDQTYIVQVRVTDSQGATATQTIQVTVTDLAEVRASQSKALTLPPALLQTAPLESEKRGLSVVTERGNPQLSPTTPSSIEQQTRPPEMVERSGSGMMPPTPPVERPIFVKLEDIRRQDTSLNEPVMPRWDDSSATSPFTIMPVEPEQPIDSKLPDDQASLSDVLMAKLDTMTKSLEEAIGVEEEHEMIVARVAALSGTTLSVGFVAWAVRSSALLASCLTTLPAWKSFDPLPVVKLSRQERDSRRQATDAIQRQEQNEFGGLEKFF
ncbi:MAG: cadherin domain-containing protein [Nitrospira sp.]